MLEKLFHRYVRKTFLSLVSFVITKINFAYFLLTNKRIQCDHVLIQCDVWLSLHTCQ